MTTIDIATTDGASCNIAHQGQTLRRRAGYTLLGVSAASLAAGIAARAPWYVRALVALPLALSSISLLQARRKTCVARAREGTIEHADFSKSRAPAATAAAARAVARGIMRDGLLMGAAGGAVAAATTLVFT